ncbi:MAG: lysophospholipid acyltransferase family protein [Alphaproteobacteria bacterium]
MKKLRYIFEAVLLYALFFIFKTMSPEMASNIGGWIGKTIGPKLAASRKAKKNITRALPDKTETEKNKIIKDMWENLGRIIAEYPHLETLSLKNTQITYKGDTKLLTQSKTPMIFFGGHIGNWEVNCAATLTQMNRPATLTYRAPNNPFVAKLLDKTRTLNGRLTAYPKSRESGRHLIKTLKNAKSIGILIDQKYAEGLNIPFFGYDAMTNPIFVQLCQKFKCPLIPIRNERLSGCNFRLTIYPPINVMNDDDTTRPIEDVIKESHKLLEEWITERPEQWLWLHRRWKNKT